MTSSVSNGAATSTFVVSLLDDCHEVISTHECAIAECNCLADVQNVLDAKTGALHPNKYTFTTTDGDELPLGLMVSDLTNLCGDHIKLWAKLDGRESDMKACVATSTLSVSMMDGSHHECDIADCEFLSDVERVLDQRTNASRPLLYTFTPYDSDTILPSNLRTSDLPSLCRSKVWAYVRENDELATQLWSEQQLMAELASDTFHDHLDCVVFVCPLCGLRRGTTRSVGDELGICSACSAE